MIYNQKEAGTIPSICINRILLAWIGFKMENTYICILALKSYPTFLPVHS